MPSLDLVRALVPSRIRPLLLGILRFAVVVAGLVLAPVLVTGSAFRDLPRVATEAARPDRTGDAADLPGAPPEIPRPRRQPQEKEPSGSTTPKVSGTIDFRGDWEKGGGRPWNCCEYGGSFDGFPPLSAQFQLVTSPVRQGRYAAKFTVNPGDRYGDSTGERSLARWLSNDGTSGSFEKEGDEFYYAWSTLFPSDWITPPNWAIFMEWHSDGRYPIAPLAFEVKGDETVTFNMATGNCTNPYVCSYRQHHPLLSTLSKGRWNDFVVRVVWHTSAGAVQIWHRTEDETSFEAALDLNRVPTLPWRNGDGKPALIYILHGLYRGGGSNTSTIYHDGFVRGTSFDAVAAAAFGSGSPPEPAPADAPSPVPSFLISSIKSGDTLSGHVRWTAEVPAGTRVVEFWADNKKLYSDTSPPFRFDFDTTKLSNGTHFLGFAWTDKSGTRRTPQVGDVTVENGPQT